MDSTSHFGYELMSLDLIFEDGEHENRIFRIPEYQRGYSWEEQQRADLFKDIEYLIKAECEYKHYIGTIVVASDPRQEEHGYKAFDLVDGQQRITTLILLLSVICRELRKSGKGHESQKISRQFIMDGSVGNTVFKLRLGQGLGTYFESLIEKGPDGVSTELAPSKSHQNLRKAVEESQAWIEEHQKKDNLDAVLQCVCEKLGFLVYAPKKTNEIGIMFEVINNRGKPLSELEKIKNYLIYFSEKNGKGDIKKKVENSWPDILGNLNKANYTSNDDENSFLRNCWIVFRDPNKARSYHVYDNLKQEWPPDEYTDDNVKDIIAFIEFLKKAAINFARYRTREGVTGKEKLWLERIMKHPGDASITPLILAISHRAKQDDREELFELLEKLNFRYYGTGISGRSDNGQGQLFGLAHKFYKYFGEEVEGEKIDTLWLKEQLRKFIHERANDGKFIESLILNKESSGDRYYLRGLKYFLASYEQELHEDQKKSTDLPKIMAPRNPKKSNDFFHQEHILAQADNRFDDVKNIHDAKLLDLNKRRLGNFMLLNEGLNIKMGNKPPEEKVESYFNVEKNTPNTLMIQEVPKFFKKAERSEKRWSNKTKNYWINVYASFFDMREEKMINFALERWRVPDLDDNISRVKLNSLDQARNEIYTTIP